VYQGGKKREERQTAPKATLQPTEITRNLHAQVRNAEKKVRKGVIPGMKLPSARLLVVPLIAFILCAGSAVSQNTKENADFKLAINLYNDRLYDLALEQLKQFIAAYPTTSQGIEARFTLGLTQLQLKQYDDARISFQTFALTYQDNARAPEAWWHVGEAYAALGNAKEAALAFERVKVFHPKSKSAADALLRASQYFNAAGERDNARRLLRTILQEYPTSAAVVSARTQLGQIFFEEGNFELAQNELKRVIDGDPSPDARAEALLILANIQQQIGRADQARKNYEEIITKYKNSGALQGAYINLARLHAAGGKTAEAIDNLKKALAITKNVDTLLVRDALVALGDAYAAQGDAQNAVTHYNRYLSMAPGSEKVPEVLGKVANAATQGRDYKRANEACARLLKAAAADELKQNALLLLAHNARAQGTPNLAIQYYGRFADLYPDHRATPLILYESAVVTEKDLHDPRKASSIYEMLVDRHGQSSFGDDALLGEARCQEQLHEYDRALQLYREFLRVFGSSEMRDEAETRVRTIETFDAKNKDAGLEKLTLLVGDVVSDKDRRAMAYRLAETSYNDLKNYEAAATYFANAIAGSPAEPFVADALYYRARSLEYLSWRDPSRAPQAVEAYRAFLTQAPTDSRAEAARLGVFNLSSGSLAEARAAYVAITTATPAFSRRDEMLLRMGALFEKADSSAAALSAYSEASLLSPTSAAAERAGYQRFRMILAAGLTDSAANIGNMYCASFPAGRYTPVVLSALGELALKRGQTDRAVDLLQRLTSEFPYTEACSKSQRTLADAFLAAGNPQSAIAIYQDLLNPVSAEPQNSARPDPSLLLPLGKAYAAAGNGAQAKRTLFALVAGEGAGDRAAEAYTALGMIYKGEGAADLATVYFRQASEASPTAAATREIADILFDSGEYRDALRQYTLLAKSAKDENERRACQARAIVATLRLDDMARADKDIAAFLQSYKETDTEAALFELERGNSSFRKEDYVRAQKSFELVASKFDDSPSAPIAKYWIGKVLEATNRPQEAITQFELIMKEHPQHEILQKVHFALGNIYYHAEKWDESIKNYRVVTDNPQPDPVLLPYAVSNLIETYETAGIFDAALTLTRKYLELYPTAEDAFDKRIKIGILYQRLGYYDQSILHLQSLLDEAGSDLEGELRYYIAESNYYKGDYQQAILDFLKVPYLVTKKGKVDWTANSLYMSGQSYEKMGRFDQALTMYKQILERPGIDETFKAGARKEIERVNTVLKKSPK
jgi:TolA-binding protein